MQQMQKNPNGGYINKNDYGLYGIVDVTPELAQQIVATGKLVVSVSSPEQREKDGETWISARTTLKPFVPKEATAHAPAAPTPTHATQPPVQAAPAPTGATITPDEMPW